MEPQGHFVPSYPVPTHPTGLSLKCLGRVLLLEAGLIRPAMPGSGVSSLAWAREGFRPHGLNATHLTSRAF